MEDGAQLVVLEREDVTVPWGFSVVPCPDGVARITQVSAGNDIAEYRHMERKDIVSRN